MRRILVTGANGQLGNAMRLLGATSRNEYRFTDVAELDITDEEAVRRAVCDGRIDVIVNCAAYTNVDRAEEDEATADRINRLAVGNLARAAAAADATLIHVSTDYVFSGDANRPYDETCETHPLGVYGRTKLAGEAEIEHSGCKSLIIRTSWLYSEFGHNFLKTMLRLTAERDRLTVVFDQTGVRPMPAIWRGRSSTSSRAGPMPAAKASTTFRTRGSARGTTSPTPLPPRRATRNARSNPATRRNIRRKSSARPIRCLTRARSRRRSG